nr:ShlB/FhaC/HecB family hemolysin secretion/activation protein [Adonisia turfae]
MLPRGSRITFSSTDVLDTNSQNKFLAPLKNKEGTFKEEISLIDVLNVINQITAWYVGEGYITSRACLPEDLRPVWDAGSEAVLEIQLIEGVIEDNIDIKIKDNENESGPLADYIRSRIHLGIGIPFNAFRLEQQLRLLREDPLFEEIEATVRATDSNGFNNQSKLEVEYVEADPFIYGVSIDNYLPPSVGSERVSVDVGYRNPTGLGDLFTVGYARSLTGGLDMWNASYQLPLGPEGNTLLLQGVWQDSEITGTEFEELDLRAESEFYKLAYRHPLLRTVNKEFALSLGFEFRDGQTFVFERLPTPFGIGPDEDGVSRTSVVTFGQDYRYRDEHGAWLAESQFRVGTGLFDATDNDSPVPDGQFVSWLGQVQRVKRLGYNQLLVISGSMQLSSDSLLPSEQFVLGGGQSLRGFQQSARSGDNGIRFSIEDRFTLSRCSTAAREVPELQVAPFFDIGGVWNASGNPNKIPEDRFLAGIGAGLIWDACLPNNNLMTRLDFALPITDFSGRGNNLQDAGIYFQLQFGSD